MDEMQEHRQQALKGSGAARSQVGREDRSFQRDQERGEGSDHPLIPAKRVNGSAVYNQAGEKIGEVEDIAIDKRTGKVAYAILSFGGFLGMGEKHQPLPWSALDYDRERDGYVIDVTEEFLRLAPKLDTSELSGWDDTAQRDTFHSYYAPMGARPYW
jgi:sporulation protein YlmC with PRC-barrel domain